MIEASVSTSYGDSPTLSAPSTSERVSASCTNRVTICDSACLAVVSGPKSYVAGNRNPSSGWPFPQSGTPSLSGDFAAALRSASGISVLSATRARMSDIRRPSGIVTRLRTSDAGSSSSDSASDPFMCRCSS